MGGAEHAEGSFEGPSRGVRSEVMAWLEGSEQKERKVSSTLVAQARHNVLASTRKVARILRARYTDQVSSSQFQIRASSALPNLLFFLGQGCLSPRVIRARTEAEKSTSKRPSPRAIIL